LTDDEVMSLVDAKQLPAYQLEKQLDNYQRGVAIRYITALPIHCDSVTVVLYQISFTLHSFHCHSGREEYRGNCSSPTEF